MPSTETRRYPLVETWQLMHPGLLARLPDLSEEARERGPSRGFGGRGEIDCMRISGLESVLCVEAAPHVDDCHHKWFAMLVLHSSGHVLHSRNIWPRNTSDWDREGRSPDVSVPLAVGQMLVMDAHRLHWLTTPESPPDYEWAAAENDRSKYDAFTVRLAPHFFVAASYDLKKRPTRENAERTLFANLKQRSAA